MVINHVNYVEEEDGMKYKVEELEVIQKSFNTLFDKCNQIMGTVDSKFKNAIRNLKDSPYHTYLRWEFNKFIAPVVDLTITKNGIDLDNNGLIIHMELEVGEELFEFVIPYEWLALDGDELTTTIEKWVDNNVLKFTKLKKHQEEVNILNKKNELLKLAEDLSEEEKQELISSLQS